MVIDTKEIWLMERDKDLDLMFIQMEYNFRVNGRMIESMEMER
jgi:hypothetical protein